MFKYDPILSTNHLEMTQECTFRRQFEECCPRIAYPSPYLAVGFFYAREKDVTQENNKDKTLRIRGHGYI